MHATRSCPARLESRTLAGVVAVLLVAAGCSDGGREREQGLTPEAGVARLTVAVPSDRGPLNLFRGADERLAELVYDKLLAPSPYVADPQPWLAEEVRQVDPSTVEARLRRGVVWHDGTPFTPEDVKFTVEYFKASPTGRWTHHVSEVPSIDEVEVIAPHGVRFTCAFPCPDLATVTLADLPVIARHKWASVPPAEAGKVMDLPVGTGPYRLVHYSPTSGYRFEANESYFAGPPLVRELVMPVITDVAATFTALRTGAVDAALRAVPPELVESFERGPVRVAGTKPLQLVELRINYERPPFDVPRFRRAVSLALDRQKLLDVVLLGRGRRADRGYPHPDSPWTSPRLSTPSDPARAQQLLDSLGLHDRDGDGVRERPTGGSLAFVLKVNGAEPTHIRAGELVIEHLRAVGIAARLETLDAGGVAALFRSRDFDLHLSEIGPHGVADPTQFVVSHRSGYLWRSPAIPYPEWDELFERWKKASTVAERRELSFEMQELFNRWPTSIPLYYPDESWAFRPAAFDGWVESPGFGIVHKWSFLRREAARRAKAFTREFR